MSEISTRRGSLPCRHRFCLRVGLPVIAAMLVATAGCAFDVVHVKQTPASFTAAPASNEAADSFVLQEKLSVDIGTFHNTHLKAGTRWHKVGSVTQGSVYATDDQVVTVEASNMHEAQLVVTGGKLVGFYLPAPKTFTATKRPITLDIN